MPDNGGRITDAEAIEALKAVREHGSTWKAAKALGCGQTSIRRRVQAGQERGLTADDEIPEVRGRVYAMARTEWPVPSKGKVARYIFTSAQSNTHLHDPLWQNLNALADHYKARICVSTMTYDVSSYGPQSVKRGKFKARPKGEPWYDPRIESHVLDESVQVAPGLVWCGEMNILPTATRPLSGLEAYTGRKSGIFPHAKFALESVASGKHEGTKINYTTGTVTQRNYIAKKAGLKAEFHHGYGALLVEVDDTGAWWCRQLNADSEGSLNDLTLKIEKGRVKDGQRIEAITWGDIHCDTLEPSVVEMQWAGKTSMAHVLRPKHQFMHDILSFSSRNHHERKDPHKRFMRYVEGQDGVVDELKDVVSFLNGPALLDDCSTIIVDSNHDNAMTRWLREEDYRSDPKNALFFLEAQLEMYRSIADRRRNFHMLEWALTKLGVNPYVRLLRPDDSYIVCPDANGGIECGMHGHLGVDGSRGGLSQFARMGRKTNTGHTHRTEIRDGAYCAGVSGNLDQGYNKGPSTWTRSHIVTYGNGKRAIVTCWRNKWRA